MSEVDRQASMRGRGSTRGGRGGIGRGGPRGGRKPTNGASVSIAGLEEVLDDQGELGEIKKKYVGELGMLKDMFPDWNDVDLLFALEESQGDLTSTVDKITQGNVSQFAEVKKSKDRARSKVKEEHTALVSDKTAPRGGRGRGGLESSRGGRGRTTERGRGGTRGGRGGHAITNGISNDVSATSVPTTESSAWDTAKTATSGTTNDYNQHAQAAKTEVASAPSSETARANPPPDAGAKKSWASMFSQPKPAPPAVPAVKHVPNVLPPVAEPAIPTAVITAPESLIHEETLEPEPPTDHSNIPTSDIPNTQALTTGKEIEESSIPPSQVPLTEENVEHLPDDSNPPPTQTVLSTAGSVDTRNATPLPSQQTLNSRPLVGGYATSAYRATSHAGRSASFQRRVQEQQEAVVLPGHNAVDRAAVQFGSMGLSGEQGLDVDEDREDLVTRQAPQDSPPSLPRTSLPPAQRHAESGQDAETPTGAKQAPGLPPASAHNHQQMQDAMSVSAAAAQEGAMNTNYTQYGRFGQSGLPQEALSQKPYDPFNHQTQQTHYDQFASQVQQQGQQSSHAGFGGLSAAHTDYSSYYTSDPSRNAYSQYYGSSYSQQDNRGPSAQAQPDIGAQRTSSGFGSNQNDAALSHQQQQQNSTQARYGEAPGSGQNTPGPMSTGPQSGAQSSQGQQSAASAHQQQQQQPGYGAASAGYPYGHPYFNSPYQAAYQNQFGYSNVPAGYGGGYPSKQGNYGVPHGYSMGGQTSYDQHSSSTTTAGGYGQNQSMRNASGMNNSLGGSLEDYNRSSGQATQQQGGAYGAISDPFARSTSGFGGQSGYGQQNVAAGQDDSLKSYNDPKNGTSPAQIQPGRPGSAANSAVGSSQGGLPPPQNQQSGFGGYPGFPGQGSQYSGFGALGTHQQGQQNNMGGQGGYGGAYGAGGFGQSYGGYGSRGGWGSNYGAH